MKNKECKKSARQYKRKYFDNLAAQAEYAVKNNDIRKVYNITYQIAGKKRVLEKPIKNKQGKAHHQGGTNQKMG
ncbi:hypothetical protein JTE90_024315 [Oedothorax gibbosus]|uniref:Uncharacterized protein n=1 Tax=Oedothorax gibbosus TaxID=931172 RepID=A0AAV6VYA8_9ARAC|nr:hypothetical protein JTE90_024315 [Oedothorax gibbosus]